MDQSEIDEHEAYRQGDAYRSVDKGTQAQAPGEWVEHEECRNCGHDHIKEKAEISYRHAVDAPIRTLEDNVASVGGHQSDRPV